MSIRHLHVLVFAVGMGSLGAEIAAVRLLAPYFGASTVVWANTIGVVLVALSLGYWIGGRWADRHPTGAALSRVALVASVMLAAVPYVARPLLDVGVTALDKVAAGAFVGSLIAVLVLVAVPVFLLGAVTPWAARIAVDDVERAGTVVGRLYALSTAGSLAGTLLSALGTIPLLGTRRTFLVFALAIAVPAIAGLRRRVVYAAVPLAFGLLALMPGAALKEAPEVGRVIYETETEYQYARVIERPDRSRVLELNEGQAVHSVYRPETVLNADYWNDHLVLPWTTGRTSAPKRVAILGNAAGTTARAYRELFPATDVDGVEIDGELSEIGRRYFDMDSSRLTVHTIDARPYLRRTRLRYDAISLDAYRQPYVPFYLTTREFFRLARSRLAPGGTVVVNVGHPRGERELERVLGATMASVFPHVMRDAAGSLNTLLVASDSPLSARRLRDARPHLPPELSAVATEAAQRLQPPLEGGQIFTDDRAPVEWLVDQSIVTYASGGG